MMAGPRGQHVALPGRPELQKVNSLGSPLGVSPSRASYGGKKLTKWTTPEAFHAHALTGK